MGQKQKGGHPPPPLWDTLNLKATLINERLRSMTDAILLGHINILTISPLGVINKTILLFVAPNQF